MAEANKVRQAGSFSMEWVKDPKNQPIVAAIAIAVIIGVGIFYYFAVIRPPAAGQTATTSEVSTSTPPTETPATTPSAAPGSAPTAAPAVTPNAAPATATVAATTATGAPASAASTTSTPAAGKGIQVASVTPMETWRGDPFQPIGYKATAIKHVTAPIRDFPFITLPGVSISRTVKREVPEIQQPSRRMAGIMKNHHIFAIIEENGKSFVVQPGDYVGDDRLAVVQRIEPDKVVLRTVDKKPRYITVRMAASAHQVAPTSTGGGSMSTAPIRRPGMSSPGGMPSPGGRRPMSGPGIP